MTLDQVRQALAARRLVAMTIGHRRGWQASARSEGGGWIIGRGETVEAAVEAMLNETRYDRSLPPIRYFVRPRHGDVMLTYNGATPLESEGPWEETDAAGYRAARDRQAADDIADLL